MDYYYIVVRKDKQNVHNYPKNSASCPELNFSSKTLERFRGHTSKITIAPQNTDLKLACFKGLNPFPALQPCNPWTNYFVPLPALSFFVSSS